MQCLHQDVATKDIASCGWDISHAFMRVVNDQKNVLCHQVPTHSTQDENMNCPKYILLSFALADQTHLIAPFLKHKHHTIGPVIL